MVRLSFLPLFFGIVEYSFLLRVAAEETGLPVSLWDSRSRTIPSSGERPKYASELPRYVLTSVSLGGRAQRATLDLGNHHEMILVGEGCTGCDPEDSPGIVEEGLERLEKCSVLPASCHLSREDDLVGGEQGFCTASRPEEYAPASSYHASSQGCPGSSSATSDAQFSPRSEGRETQLQVCAACFGGGCGSHTRFFAPASAPSLSFVHDCGLSGRGDDDSKDSAVVATYNDISFGVLLYTKPKIDRTWGNVGVGYHSSFLTQADVHSLLVSLHYGQGTNEVVLNPRQERYNGWPSVGYYVDNNGRRVHSGVSLHVGETSKSDAFFPQHHYHHNTFIQNEVFHVDTGNSGISIASSHIKDELAQTTGGRWVSRSYFLKTFDFNEEFFLQDDSMPENDGAGGLEGTVTGSIEGACREPAHFVLPLSYRSQLPELHVNLGDDVVVSIPGWMWVLPESSNMSPTSLTHNHNENEDFIPTVLSSYHKNVLGLPFIMSTGGLVYDDVGHKIHIKQGGDSAPRIELSSSALRGVSV